MPEVASLPLISLKPRKALPFFSRHPWMYPNAIKSISTSVQLGDEVEVHADDGQFIGRGLYNPHSKIRVRMYAWAEAQTITTDLLRERIRSAIQLRRMLYGNTPAWTACRLIFSEADGLSGLTVDRFGDWLVVQWTSAALHTRSAEILEILQEELQPQGIFQRTEKGIKELEGLNIDDGLISGSEPPRPLFIEENGLQFGVDLLAGQKTGFYFDQRDNRQLFRSFAAGRRVLDACSYTASFAINAAAENDCESVVALDSSKSALELAEQNAQLNSLGHKLTFRQADVFDGLQAAADRGEKFDLIALDPPKLARTRGGLNRALKAYIRLNRLAISVLDRDGILMTCSCSGHVSREAFEQVLAAAALESDRSVQILFERGQAADHPVLTSCLETSYLKAFFCRVE